jgi:uncharacterized protein YlxW (UPF0749 family)
MMRKILFIEIIQIIIIMIKIVINLIMMKIFFKKKKKEKIKYISDEKQNEIKLIHQIKDINSLLNNLSEKMKNTSSNINTLKMELKI